MSPDEILQEVQAAYTRLHQAAHTARYAYDHYLDDLKATYTQRLREIDQAFQRASVQAEADYQGQLAQADATFQQATQQSQANLATLTSDFRWIVTPWDHPAWDTYTPPSSSTIPSAVRLGRLAVPDAAPLGDLPALAALIGQGHLFIQGQPPATTQSLLATILLRLVVSSPPGSVRLVLADPVGKGATLSAFLRLPDTLRGDRVSSRAEEIERQLDTLEQHIVSVIQTRLLNIYPTLEAYNEQAGELAVPYHILALADFPAAFNDRMAERLLDIARNGPRAGVYMVATVNQDHALPRNFNLQTLLKTGAVVSLTGPDRATWNDPEFGQYAVTPDPLPSPDRVNTWLRAVGDIIGQTSTSLPFRRLSIPPSDRWTGDATSGLRVPIGINATGEVHDLDLGRGVVHHALIGGTVGSGKSNLLHLLITQLALRYAPEEVELYLVDFKEGVEFQDYLTLPHARTVALETEREFGLSVLRRLQTEMEDRGRRFRTAGVNDLAEYRRQTGQRLPRVVLVMDEFQVLFIEDDRLSQETGRLLEDLVRRGRAFGIHIILSSQSPSGGPAYGRRIYDQMGLRIALRSRPQDAQAILGENDAANRLEQPGEAIYNDDMGHKESNIRIRVGLLSPQERRQALAALAALAQVKPYPAPVTFERRTPARLHDNPEFQALLSQPGWPPRAGSAQLWLGQPIEIKPATTATLERYMRSNLLVVGGDEAQAYGLLLAALLSLAAQRAPAASAFYIADFSRPDAPFAALFRDVAARLPHSVELAGPRQVGGVLAQLTNLVAKRVAGEAGADTDTYFLVAGLHRWRELRPADPYGQTDAGKQLLRLADEGPEVGVHLLVWSDGFATLERAFKRGGVGSFDLRVALRLSEKDSNDLLSSNVAARLEDNRAIFRNEDWEMGRLEKFKPYALSDPATLQALLQSIARKAPGGPS